MSGKRNLLHWSMSGKRNILHWSMSGKRNILHWSMSGKRILPWMHLQGCWKRSGAEVLPTCPGVWRRGKNKLAKREFVSLLISDKEKKTVSVLGHFSLLHTESKYQLPVYQMIKKNQEWNYIGSSSLFGRAGLTLKFLEIFKKILRTFKTVFVLSKNFHSTALRPLHPEYWTPYLCWLQQILGMSN